MKRVQPRPAAAVIGANRYLSISGENHMSIVHTLGTPGTLMADLSAACIEGRETHR